MATIITSQQEQVEEKEEEDVDSHEHDMVMPGFRFHPKLIEFYLRRKVEGKHFNVELITFLDLYRYDPWELPGLAAIGEKEWYFYVPRDRKYRNGDRPNRVTTSGYWKATGADRMIKTENSRTIRLKKTLVFYSGKAPKGVRSSWIMNEYRLPQHETQRSQKVETSICRVYKRAVMEDFPTRGASSLSRLAHKKHIITHDVAAAAPPNQAAAYNNPYCQISDQTKYTAAGAGSSSTDGDIIKTCRIDNSSIAAMSSDNCSSSIFSDDLHRLVNFQQYPNPPAAHLSTSALYPQQQQHNMLLLPAGSFQAPAVSDRLWDWNSVTSSSDPPISSSNSKDFHNSFK